MRKILILSVLSACLAFCIVPFQTNAESFPHAFTAACLRREPVEIRNDTTPKISLLKKMVNFLKFHKNIREAERKRILGIIDQTFFKDSIMANAREIRMLNVALKDTVNQKFDSLVTLINNIQLSEEEKDSLLPPDTAGTGNDTVINDSVVHELLNRILPLLIEKTGQEHKSVMRRLTILQSIRFFYGRPRRPVDTLKLTDTVKTILTDAGKTNFALELILKRKAPVYSFFPSGMGGNYLDYNFNIISTLIYDGYTLDGKTGLCNDTGKPGTANSLKHAKKAGCRVLLTINGGRQGNAETFLKNEHDQQEMFVRNIPDLMREQGADGINIDFGLLNAKYRQSFTAFMEMLSDTLKRNCPNCKLIITIPSGNKNSAYDINELNTSDIKFLIDFSHNLPPDPAGPPAPLKGDRGIESTISRYLNSNVPPSKFIIGLPYYGAQWETGPGGVGDQFIQYLSFDEIASQFSAPVLHDPGTASAFINLMNDKKQLTGQIWYNDTTALNDIYTFILQNGLGGVAVLPLSTKIGFSDLWTGIGNKFISIHTIPVNYFKYIKYKELEYMDSVEQESFSSSWKHFTAYDSLEIGFLFEHPCETEFPTGYKSPVLNQSLYKDSTILLMNDSAILNQSLYSILSEYDTIPMDTRMASRVKFFRVHRVFYCLTLVMSLFFLACFIAVSYIYINKLRKSGKRWKYRRVTGVILLLLAALFIFFVFTYLFLSDIVPGFGSNKGVCYDMPVQTLLTVIISGIVLGIIVMRYLIFPLIKKEDVP